MGGSKHDASFATERGGSWERSTMTMRSGVTKSVGISILRVVCGAREILYDRTKTVWAALMSAAIT
jgi:hypothetical protein